MIFILLHAKIQNTLLRKGGGSLSPHGSLHFLKVIDLHDLYPDREEKQECFQKLWNKLWWEKNRNNKIDLRVEVEKDIEILEKQDI